MLGGAGWSRRWPGAAARLQVAMGAVMVVVALAMLGQLRHQVPEQDRQLDLPGFLVNPTEGLEDTRLGPRRARRRPRRIGPRRRRSPRPSAPQPRDDARAGGLDLPVLGTAPEFVGNQRWFNTPGDQPLTLKRLRGRVVLVDFWTYSCINCLRTLPYLKAWDRPLPQGRPDDRRRPLARVPLREGRRATSRKRSSATGSTIPSPRTTNWRPGAPTATSTGRPSTSSTPRAGSATPTSARASTARRSRSSASCWPKPGRTVREAEPASTRIAPRRP